MKYFWLILFFAASFVSANDQSTYLIQDPATNRNFTDTNYQASQHRHMGTDGSARPHDFIPETDSAYDLGASDAKWANLYVDSITLNGSDLQTYIAIHSLLNSQ